MSIKTLTLLLIILPFNLLAHDDKIVLTMIDGYTNLPISNTNVYIENLENKIVFTSSTNVFGNILFNTNQASTELICRMDNTNFLTRKIDFSQSGIKTDSLKIYFYPTPDYEQKMIEKENETHRNLDITKSDQSTNQAVEDIAEEDAEFYGGMSKFYEFISLSTIYPDECYEKNETGKVFIQFVIEKDGTVTNVNVKKGATQHLDNEAKRVIRSSPKWKPANNKGIKVRERFVIPILFSTE